MTILTVIVGLLFVVTGGVKIAGLQQSLDIRDHFGMSPTLWRMIGTLETAGGVGTIIGLEVEALGVAALIGLSALMVGAIASRIKVKDAIGWILADAGTLALVVVTLVLTLS